MNHCSLSKKIVLLVMPLVYFRLVSYANLESINDAEIYKLYVQNGVWTRSNDPIRTDGYCEYDIDNHIMRTNRDNAQPSYCFKADSSGKVIVICPPHLVGDWQYGGETTCYQCREDGASVQSRIDCPTISGSGGGRIG